VQQLSVSRRRIALGYLAIVLAVATLWGGVEAVIQRFGSASQDVRLGLWRDTLRIVRDFPLMGSGLNTYGIAMLHYQTVPGDALYIEAHNDYLQIAAEGGLVLSGTVVVALGLFAREIWRRFREDVDDPSTYWLRVGAVTGLGAIAVQETVDFTLQMPGAAVLFVILAAIAIHRPTHRVGVASRAPVVAR
jgi:O-antigen ligase